MDRRWRPGDDLILSSTVSSLKKNDCFGENVLCQTCVKSSTHQYRIAKRKKVKFTLPKNNHSEVALELYRNFGQPISTRDEHFPHYRNVCFTFSIIF